MPTIDRKPTPPRKPIVIAGALVRRGDKLGREAAVCIRDLVDKLATMEVERDDILRDIDQLADLMADSTELLVKDTPIIGRLNDLCHDASPADPISNAEIDKLVAITVKANHEQ